MSTEAEEYYIDKKGPDSTAIRHGRVLRALFLGLALLGLVSVIVMIVLVSGNRDALVFLVAFTKGLSPACPALIYLILTAAILGGTAVFILSMLEATMSALSVERSKKLNRVLEANGGRILDCASRNCSDRTSALISVITVIIALCIILQIILAVGNLVFLNATFSAIEELATEKGSQFDTSSSLGRLKSDISTLQLASFNECCAAKGWSAQGEIEACPSSGLPPDCTLPYPANTFAKQLCTCYTSSRYTEFKNYLQQTQICQQLSTLTVVVTDTQKIPGTNVPIKAVVPVASAQIVGFNGSASENSEQTGYGCGFGGYAKAYQWMMFEHLSQTTSLTAIILIVLAVAEVVVICFIKCLLVDNKEHQDFVEFSEQVMVAAHRVDMDKQLSADRDTEDPSNDSSGQSRKKSSSSSSSASSATTALSSLTPSRRAPLPPV